MRHVPQSAISVLKLVSHTSEHRYTILVVRGEMIVQQVPTAPPLPSGLMGVFVCSHVCLGVS